MANPFQALSLVFRKKIQLMHLFLRRILTLAFFAALTQFSVNAQCEYRLEMEDSFGDGWNGGILTITSGTNIMPFTLNGITDNGIDSTVYFMVEDQQPLTFTWLPGFFNGEVSFQIYDFEDNLIYQASGPATGVLYTGVGACPSCLKPQNVTIENIYDTRMKANWTPVGTNPGIEWLVIYGAPGFDLDGGEGDTIVTLLPKVTLTGLEKKTDYEFYVVQNCGMDDYSAAAGPYAFQTYWTNDVGIADILTPASSCSLGVEKITIVLKNYGSNPQSLLPFRFSVNGEDGGVSQPNDGFYTGVLGKDSCEVIEFETEYDFSAPGEYLISVYTEMMNDEDFANDTFHIRIVNRLQAPYFQDFEDWAGGWYVNDTLSLSPSWEFGQPANNIIDMAASGVNAWVTNLDGSYNPGELSYLNSPCFDFSTLDDDPVIEFSIIYNIEQSYDGVFLEMSLDGGNVWEKVGEVGTGLNWYTEPNLFSGLGDVWAGTSNGWITARQRLFGTGGESDVRLRFGFGSDGSVNFEGAGVDDIRIYVPLANDMAGIGVTTLGENVECGLEEDEVIFTFTNFGTDPQGIFPIWYSVNGGAPVQDVVGTIVSPDEVISFNFSIPFDSRDGEFVIQVWTALNDDEDRTNDTLTYTVSHLPRPVPFSENFEAGTFIPDGWSSFGFVTSSHNNISNVLAYNLYQFNPSFTHTTPRYGVISEGDSLRFDYRISNFSAGTTATVLTSGDKIEVRVSTDCGGSFTTLYVITDTSHTPSVALQTLKLDLSAFAGESINIQFRGTWGSGDYYFDIDNINLQACPVSMGLTATTVASDPGMSNGSATVSVGLGTAPYTYAWSDGQTGETATDLPTGVTTVTVTDANGCSDVLEIAIGNSSSGELESLESWSIRPNPTQGTAWVTLAFTQPVDVQIQLVNLLGQRVWESNSSHSKEVNKLIDLSTYPDGVYLVRFMVDGRLQTEKLIKSGN
jgi:hypothetical protein